MRGVDAVVHMAALLHIVNPPPELREKYERVNIGGTATVVEAAIKAGVKRVVLFSTIAVYGPSDGRVPNEMSPTHPDTFYAETKRAAEQIVLNARSADGQRRTPIDAGNYRMGADQWPGRYSDSEEGGI